MHVLRSPVACFPGLVRFLTAGGKHERQRGDEEEADDGPGALPEEDHDEMYDKAVALVAETRQASISMIQRRLRVGYNRAARMVERMEREGVVGPPDRVKGREVLISPI